jgi:hypothetical protein
MLVATVFKTTIQCETQPYMFSGLATNQTTVHLARRLVIRGIQIRWADLQVMSYFSSKPGLRSGFASMTSCQSELTFLAAAIAYVVSRRWPFKL